MKFANAGHVVEYEEIVGLTGKLWNLWYTIESQWWGQARAELDTVGYISHNARDNADTLCASAIHICNEILSRFATVTGETYTPLSWTTSTNSMYPAPNVARAIEEKVIHLRELFWTANTNDAWDAYTAALAGIYSEVSTLIGQIGPNFPTPLTSFYSLVATGASEYDRPRIGAGFSAKDTMYLVCVNTYEGEMVALQGASSGFHKIAAGDTIHLQKFPIPGYEEFAGKFYVVDSVAAGGIVLTVPYTEQLPFVASEIATTVGDFTIRKVKGS